MTIFERCEKLARRYARQVGLKSIEETAILELDLQQFALEIWNEAVAKCARQVRDDQERIGNWKRVEALKITAPRAKDSP